MTAGASVQERLFPDAVCFGCGPANEQGLRIRSFRVGQAGEVACQWDSSPHHVAAPGYLNGGIVGTLLDCHLAAAVIDYIDDKEGGMGDGFVTREMTVKYLRPTPEGALELTGRVVDDAGDDITAEGELVVDGKVRATCRAVFTRLRPR